MRVASSEQRLAYKRLHEEARRSDLLNWGVIPSTYFRQIASVKIPRKDDTRSLSVTEVKC